MKDRVLLPALAALLLTTVVCRKREPPPQLERHALTGVVVSVDPPRSRMTVSHEAVAGYMGAMTMSFPVRDDPRVIAILRPGDKVEATLVVNGDQYWLEKILTKGFVANAAAGASASATPGEVTPVPNRALAVGDSVPDFSLIDQTGSRVRLVQFRGQPVALTFIYTRCPIATACPMTTAKFSRLDAMLAQEKFGQLLTLSLDPANDTPQVLADYAKKAGADSRRWKFLTGDSQTVAEVASRMGILYYRDHGQLVHGQGVVVIDPKGTISAVYYGDDWQPEQILADLRKARSEKAS